MIQAGAWRLAIRWFPVSMALGAASILMPVTLSLSAPAQDQASPEVEMAAVAQRPGAWVVAVQTDGKASFRICRYSMFSADCRTYGHIRVPDTVARNDQFVVSFGSNRKQVTFTVKSIRLSGTTCEIYGTTGDEKPDRLISRHCVVQPENL